ncbi:hypothetical protein [Flavobacterium urocaniciphilum]|uniref:Outermembrane protein n=1 Tax=Flavobacterium urocaniciphilum TaxID=1299341 RepID=A0A1H8ZQF5_9FLAO|nr:hypothetical protein [Flavobacterium urocaniciphilum]SEP65908.1 hypothetical protein SAMN05444005_101810 [Flavobacterium urocaniciphilum]
MKQSFLMVVLSFCVFSQYTFSQETVISPEKYTAHNKGKLFFFWGGNRETYTKSDIHFYGENYDFVVHNAEAQDKPKGLHIDYINPERMTIPQTNFKLGYFISDHYNIAIGFDHMKYVFSQHQTANVSGYVNLPASDNGSLYNGTYNNTPIDFSTNYSTDDNDTPPPFLTFEHTDGLNYIHTEFSRVDDISSKIFKTWNSDKVQINLTEGLGAGILLPKTNTRLLGKDRYDEFHVAGYGISAKAGLNVTFFKHFFVQAELKGGYIDMNDIRTTQYKSDKAEQHFWFFQSILAFGGIFRI